MPGPTHHKEAHKRPTLGESVQSLIDRKSQEKPGVSTEVSRKMTGTQEGVAEVLAGMEKPSEKPAERQGERGSQGDLKTGKGGRAQAAVQAIKAAIPQYLFPSEELMVKQIRVAIEEQIKHEWRVARSLEKRLDHGGAEAYNASIAKIRKLKDLLASLLTSTVDFLKNLYIRYFTADGKRKKVDEL